MAADFDVIVVGGRPAGAGLAHRLGALGWRVLVLDRQRPPSTPHVPSSPALHMGTLALLDEIGISEASLAAVGARFEDYVLRFGTWWEAAIRLPEVRGRAHGYGVRRDTFDALLWDTLARWPTVTRRAGFAVEGLLRDASGGVIGVEGREGRAEVERLSARWVVGADGRFSAVARMAGAGERERRDVHASTVYLAEWEGVGPRASGAGAEFEVYTDGRGTDLLFIPMPDGRISVTTHQRHASVDIGGDAEGYYRSVVARYPWYAERFAGARLVGRVTGLKKVGNGYRAPAGAGWALVGDAFHFKDPVDGQGIYDALLTGRLLAEELDAFLGGRQDAAVTAQRYDARATAETHPMFEATLLRLQRELYGPAPNVVLRNVLRWFFTDPAFQLQLFRFFARDPAIDPRAWQTPGLALGCIARGIGRDVAARFGRRALPGPAV